MNVPEDDVKLVQHALVGEFFRIIGLPPEGRIRLLFGPIINRPTRRFSELIVEFDRGVAEWGITAASRDILDRFTEGSSSRLANFMPTSGGLIVVSNHPGTFDFFTVMSRLPREDIKFLISGVPVVRSLPASSEYLIYVPGDPHGRIRVIREAIRHLKNDGCLVLFPTGILDPDPEVLPGSRKALEKWSQSLDLFLRHAPDAFVQVAIVSGVLPGDAIKNPLTVLVREKWKKQRLAEFLYVARMMVQGGKFSVHPKISFAEPIQPVEFSTLQKGEARTELIIERAIAQLNKHCDRFPCVSEKD